MLDSVNVELSSTYIQTEVGGKPAELVVTIYNLGDVVDQFSVEISGLDPDWFTAPIGTVGLFPRDQEQVRITLHPPKRRGVHAGRYPFQVSVRSQAGTQHESVDGTLEVCGQAIYRLDLAPRRTT